MNILENPVGALHIIQSVCFFLLYLLLLCLFWNIIYNLYSKNLMEYQMHFLLNAKSDFLYYEEY